MSQPNKRPWSVIVTSWIFVAVGFVSLVAHLLPVMRSAVSAATVNANAESLADFALASISALLAIGGGVFILFGFNWARWLCVAWMGFHVILSVWHPPLELLVHSALFIAVLYLLFRPAASAYFRNARARSE